jgi:hypothetical protein
LPNRLTVRSAMRSYAVYLAFALLGATPIAQTQPAPTQVPLAIPSCLAEATPTAAAGSAPVPSPTPPAADVPYSICDARAALLSDPADVSVIDPNVSSESLNQSLHSLSFEPGTTAVHFRIVGDLEHIFGGPNELVRFSADPVKAIDGRWWTTCATVTTSTHQLRSATDIEKILALTYAPTYAAFAYGTSPGADVYFGMVAQVPDEPGGGIEFLFDADGRVGAQSAPLTSTTICPPGATPSPGARIIRRKRRIA